MSLMPYDDVFFPHTQAPDSVSKFDPVKDLVQSFGSRKTAPAAASKNGTEGGREAPLVVELGSARGEGGQKVNMYGVVMRRGTATSPRG